MYIYIYYILYLSSLSKFDDFDGNLMAIRAPDRSPFSIGNIMDRMEFIGINESSIFEDRFVVCGYPVFAKSEHCVWMITTMIFTTLYEVQNMFCLSNFAGFPISKQVLRGCLRTIQSLSVRSAQ